MSPTKPAPQGGPARARAARPEPDLELLRQLSNAIGVSGDEGAVRRLVLEAIRPHVDELQVDALGSILAVKRAAGRRATRRRVLMAAHMDEVGLMVMDHDSDGALRFEIVGGIAERCCWARRCWWAPSGLPGVIGAAPVHLLSAERQATVIRTHQMRIDIGAGSAEAARRLVSLGDRAAFATEFSVRGGTLRGKALDDRLGCATLIALLRGGPYPVELHAAFTVQEEVGLRGARVAGYAAEPDAAFALDCTPALDLPDSRGRENTQYNTRLGLGRRCMCPTGAPFPTGGWWTTWCARPRQPACPTNCASRAAAAPMPAPSSRRGAGVPVVSVSVPARYLHGPVAMARLDDWRARCACWRWPWSSWAGRIEGAAPNRSGRPRQGMKDAMKPLIKKLVESYGPSGSEAQIRDLVRDEIRGLPDYITVDPLGNLIAVVKKKAKSGKKVILAAHLDEIGLVVSHIDRQGYARFQPFGGVNPLAAVGGRVRFADGRLGVVGLDARRDDANKIPTLSEMFIDVGATSAADCPLKIGDAAGFWRPMEEQGDRLVAKSMDDRIGVAILIETLRRSSARRTKWPSCSRCRKRWGCAARGWRPLGWMPTWGWRWT